MMILYRVHPRAEKDTLVAADAAQPTEARKIDYALGNATSD
jgi:hypothetical protein